jgi:amidophosphoribosyltransferase
MSQYGIDLATPQELIAHEKTREDIARHINADDVIYQDLDDLKAACLEVTPGGKVEDFEVGVFCGKYKTAVPEGYFEHLNQSRGKKRKMAEGAAVATGATGGGVGAGSEAVVGNSGPVNVAAKRVLVDGGVTVAPPSAVAAAAAAGAELVNGEDRNAGMENPNNRQDIRYVLSCCTQSVKVVEGLGGC